MLRNHLQQSKIRALILICQQTPLHRCKSSSRVKVGRKTDCYFQVSSCTIFYNKSIIDFQFACHLKVLGDVVLFFFRELRGWSVVVWEEKGRYFKSTQHGCCVISRDERGYRLGATLFSSSGLKHMNCSQIAVLTNFLTETQTLAKFSMVFSISIRHLFFFALLLKNK